MKIAFYLAKHGYLYDKLIAFATLSKYSHCEIIFNSGICASASNRDDGVRFNNIDFGNGNWDVFDLDSNLNELKTYKWFVENDGDKYDMLGAITSVLHIDISSDNKKYCSQACAMALGFKDTALTPEGLYQKLNKLDMIK